MRIFKKIATISALSIAMLAFASCQDTDVVESGTYTGTIDKVEPEKTEIYVNTTDDKRLELYFTETTELTRNGQTVDFSILEKDMDVEVTVEKVGNRLDPIAVRILE